MPFLAEESHNAHEIAVTAHRDYQYAPRTSIDVANLALIDHPNAYDIAPAPENIHAQALHLAIFNGSNLWQHVSPGLRLHRFTQRIEHCVELCSVLRMLQC